MKDITAEQARESSKAMLKNATEDFLNIQERAANLKKRWDESNEIFYELDSLGSSIFGDKEGVKLSEKQKTRTSELRKEWRNRVKEDKLVLQKINVDLSRYVGNLYRFYKSLSVRKRRYFNEMDIEDIRKKYAMLIMAYSFHNHMTLHLPSDYMKWIGFKYNAGWNYNGVNYGR